VIHRFSIQLGGKERELSVEALDGGRWRVTHEGRARVWDVRKVHNGTRSATWSLLPDGGGPAALVDVDGGTPDLTVGVGGMTAPLKIVDARSKLAAHAAARSAQGGPHSVRSPMPGKVVKVLVQAGDEVKTGSAVVVVEAMKMENELRAPRDGRIKEVPVREGQAVEAGQPLVILE
jgi:biotin carboxyl carrier protein